MWSKIISVLTGAPAESIAEYFKERQRLKQELKIEKLKGKVELQKAKAAADAQAAANAHEWELARIKDSGFKDEWVLGLISVPLVGCFIPVVQVHILRGFGVLEETPLWYVSIVVAIFLAVYGIRWKGASDIKIKD